MRHNIGFETASALSRRQFIEMSAFAAPIAALAVPKVLFAAPRARGSTVHGVQIGVISSAFGPTPVEQIIPLMVRIGLGEIELTANHAEALAGAPRPPASPQSADSGSPPQLNAEGLVPRCAKIPLIAPDSPTAVEFVLRSPPAGSEEEAAQRTFQEQLRAWRASTSIQTWHKVRGMFDAAGIQVRILWYGMGFIGPAPSDEDIEYAFTMAQGLGVQSMSGSSLLSIAPRIARAADRHRMNWGGHTQDNIHNPAQFATPEAYEKLLGLGSHMRICLDIGYFTAAGFDSVAFIREHHARISDIHLKDRKRSRSLGADVTSNLVNNWPFGQGDSPIREVLQLLKRERFDIPVQIEYDYSCRTTSDPGTEIARCYEYCRTALT